MDAQPLFSRPSTITGRARLPAGELVACLDGMRLRTGDSGRSPVPTQLTFDVATL